MPPPRVTVLAANQVLTGVLLGQMTSKSQQGQNGADLPALWVSKAWVSKLHPISWTTMAHRGPRIQALPFICLRFSVYVHPGFHRILCYIDKKPGPFAKIEGTPRVKQMKTSWPFKILIIRLMRESKGACHVVGSVAVTDFVLASVTATKHLT